MKKADPLKSHALHSPDLLAPGLMDSYILQSMFMNAQHVLILQSAGDVKPGGGIETEDDEAGSYLAGSPMNAALVQNFCVKNGIPQANITVRNYSVAERDDPEKTLRRFCAKPGMKFIYYTGHGDKTGAWCFKLYGKEREVRIQPQHVERFAGGWKNLAVFSQSCYSGHWADCGHYNVSSASPDGKSRSSETGSEVTKFVFDDGSFPVNSTIHVSSHHVFNLFTTPTFYAAIKDSLLT